MKRKKSQEKNEEIVVVQPKFKSDTRRRPYGLLTQQGISTSGMSPREAWATWNEFRREDNARRKAEQGKSKEKRKPAGNLPWKKGDVIKSNGITAKVLDTDKQGRTLAEVTDGKLGTMRPGKKFLFTEQSPCAKGAETLEKESAVKIPILNERNVWLANSNSMTGTRGDSSKHDYEIYAKRILSWDISDAKKQQLLNELHKRWERQLSYEAQHVPWTVAGPARYNAKKYDKGMEVLRESASILDWFKGVEESVKNSKTQYRKDYSDEAKRAEEWFEREKSMGWLNNYQTKNLDATKVANALAPLAKYDQKRFIELYEQYDKQLKFKKNTNAAKLYETVKTGNFKGASESAQKLYENGTLNTYKKTIQSGERVFMKFTTRPKRQMVVALKSRGWHWNSNEDAWSVPVNKYDEEFVKGIEQRYEKYL